MPREETAHFIPQHLSWQIQGKTEAGSVRIQHREHPRRGGRDRQEATGVGQQNHLDIVRFTKEGWIVITIKPWAECEYPAVC